MKKIIFDVGANDGEDGIRMTGEENAYVYAFEPSPFMTAIIKEKVIGKGLNNYELIEKAVSDFDGMATFNICSSDTGRSSLLEFSDNTAWLGHGPFRKDAISDRINVEVIRMDTFLKERGIDHVDYFHCDVQGNDLKVLQSFGELISIVGEGVIEACSSVDTALYDKQHTQMDAENFLKSNGFTITSIETNDVGRKEVNIKFKRV